MVVILASSSWCSTLRAYNLSERIILLKCPDGHTLNCLYAILQLLVYTAVRHRSTKLITFVDLRSKLKYLNLDVT